MVGHFMTTMENAIFEASIDGTFTYEDITIESDGPVGYKVYLDAERKGDPVEVPHVHVLLSLLRRLTGNRPVFTSLADGSLGH